VKISKIGLPKSRFPLFSRLSTSKYHLTVTQIQPRPDEADPAILQTAHTGLTVAMLDGSVRVIRHGIQVHTYWALITPSAGDVATLD
jgi:hypothetical protein